MAHSVRKRKQREWRKKTLDKHVKDIRTLAAKHFVQPQEIHLPFVALGDLRRRYCNRNPGYHAIPWRLKRAEYKGRFVRYPLDPIKPLVVKGSDDGLLLVRTRINDPAAISDLTPAVEALPKPKNYKFKGIKRSDYRTMHYGTWAPYAKQCLVTKELRDANQVGFGFMGDYTPVWTEMSRVLGQYAPGVFKQFQLYPLNTPTKRFCGAWTCCVVNDGGNNANQTEAHRDVKEAQYGYSCILAAGDFTGGALVLYELEMVVEMAPGDLVLFPDCLITHRNESAEGKRISIVTFTQENVYDYWHREYNMKLRRHDRMKSRMKRKKAQKKAVRSWFSTIFS